VIGICWDKEDNARDIDLSLLKKIGRKFGYLQKYHLNLKNLLLDAGLLGPINK